MDSIEKRVRQVVQWWDACNKGQNKKKTANRVIEKEDL